MAGKGKGAGGALRARSLKWEQSVQREIRDHGKWCGRECQMFSMTAYRTARLEHSREAVQGDYDLCHAWR